MAKDVFPAFQFDSDRYPLPVVAELLSILETRPRPTDWATRSGSPVDTGWLDGGGPSIAFIQTRSRSPRSRTGSATRYKVRPPAW